MRTHNRAQQVVLEYRDQLREILGDELDSVVLYGSQVRRDATAESDIDVLCVMRRPFDYGEMIEATSEVTAEISLKYDVVLSRAFVTLDDYRFRQTPFLANVRREGVAI
jgi:predicted nucleotidyltransferase